MRVKDSFFHYFKAAISGISIPTKFTFPFFYEPHPLSKIAANELQIHLESLVDLHHNFGLDESKSGMVIGKMFGVLVVENTLGELGYLAAFSGKLADSNEHQGFVPPVYDMLGEAGFFLTESEVLNALNREIEALENSDALNHARERLEALLKQSQSEIEQSKQKLKFSKRERDALRSAKEMELSTTDFETLKNSLAKQSIEEQLTHKRMVKSWRITIEEATQCLISMQDKIQSLKDTRKQKSVELQKKLFAEYTFLNAKDESKNVVDVFTEIGALLPPAGAGECAAPKLLHYAYKNGFKPICMAEFWWGASPKSEVRQHKNFYPACRGKCEPILGHMLQGLDVEENPMLDNPAEGKEIQIVFEDDYLVIINKPAEFLSVPGKNITDSVLTRLKQLYPNATGPLLVHRLDMSTSGILVAAKTEHVHKHLQSQFIRRKVKKRYVALLDGVVEATEGIIDLPLRVDLDNRPHQLVCYEHGKPARTEFKVVAIEKGKTRIHFFPITGRTHQLRVHAAHNLGLNTPIIGDDLYGKRADRLHLHAEFIEFTHPITKEVINFTVPSEF